MSTTNQIQESAKPTLPGSCTTSTHSPSHFTNELKDLSRELSALMEHVLELKSQQSKTHSEEIACQKELQSKQKQLEDCHKYYQQKYTAATATGSSTTTAAAAIDTSASNTFLLDSTVKSEMNLQFKLLSKDISTMKNLLPRNPSFFLRQSLGTANFTLPETAKLRYKAEYENFKLKMTIVTFISSLINLFLVNIYWVDVAYYFSLLYFYWSVTLREHILLVNGSRIRSWWLVHHYLSIALTGTMLIWPSSSSLTNFRDQFYWFSLYLSAVQYLQYRYQMDRLYTLRALSKIGPMDVTTDSAQVHVRNSLTFLLPFLIAGQLFQFYNGYTLYLVYLQPTTLEWQVILCSILYFLLGFGNLSTTLLTFFQKLKKTSASSKTSSSILWD